MNNEQLIRYQKHILLSQIGYEGQKTLTEKNALVVGLGGLGSPVSLYLAASGVNLVIADFDKVELSNLQRQILYTEKHIGKLKTTGAQKTLSLLNSQINIKKIGKQEIYNNIKTTDIVLDCSDNFATKFTLNRYCSEFGKPLISGAAMRFYGQIFCNNWSESSACYHCLFSEDAIEDTENCADCGVFSPLLGVVGSLQASFALKILLKKHDDLINKLFTIDLLDFKTRQIAATQNPECTICQSASTAK